jgi:hypothetical protein
MSLLTGHDFLPSRVELGEKTETSFQDKNKKKTNHFPELKEIFLTSLWLSALKLQGKGPKSHKPRGLSVPLS